MRDRKVPLDLKHSIKVLEAYGRLHAISFAMRDQKPVEFQRLADNLHESWFHDLRKVPFQKLLNGHNELGLSSIKDCNNENALNLYKDYTEHTYDRLMASIHPKAAGNFAVIGHGDSWINNILFKYEDDESFPDKLCLLDFQLSRIGSPSLDLSYFIFTCTDRDLRCEHFDTLLRSYHDSLFKHIRLLGSDPEALYPYDVLLDHMRRFSVFGLMMTGMVLHVMMSDKDEIPDTRQQSTDQMIDSMSFKSSNEHKIKHRLRDVILDMAEKGYLDNA